MERKHLLIVSCSKKKRKMGQKILAIDLYQGRIFGLIKKFGNPKIDVLIISAKYGLLKPEDKIKYYDESMSKSKAEKLRPNVLKKLSRILKKKKYEEIFINLGKNYLLAIKGFRRFVDPSCKIIYAEGKMGQKMKQTKDWFLNH